jgi:hypothetical protein
VQGDNIFLHVLIDIDNPRSRRKPDVQLHKFVGEINIDDAALDACQDSFNIHS